MDSAKPELIEKIKAANTVLVTVSRNPSIDQLAACIGLTLLVVKLKKHGSAVFSGDVPSTIEFLKPEETLEKNTDSLRDFIIALDKSKADKLRYKVEDQMVKIFITPYRTSLNEDDLEFSQGDFNVDLVVTLGVEKNEDLDQAIGANGNILHDATIISINTTNPGALGSINWNVPQASSLCELVAELAGSLGEKIIDEQIATALLTGIVAETERFSNDKTTSLTMSISSELMAAGANQQLVATELAEGEETDGTSEGKKPAAKKDDGELDVNHVDKGDKDDNSADQPVESDISLPVPISEGEEVQDEPEDKTTEETATPTPKLVSEPPALGGTLTANSAPQNYEPTSDPLTNAASSTTASDSIRTGEPLQLPNLTPGANAPGSATLPPSDSGFTPPPSSWVPPYTDNVEVKEAEGATPRPKDTISSLEESVHSPHVNETDINAARSNIESALEGSEPLPQTAAIPKPPVIPPPPPPAPPVDNGPDANFKYPDELDPKELTPPSDMKAPPYPPPIVTPPSPDSNSAPA